MARSFTNTTENDVLNSLFGTPGYTAHPANLVLRLSTVLPSDAGGITEPSGGAYVEQAITFGAASGGAVSNANTITFPVATAPWGKIVGWAVRDTVAGISLCTGYMGALYDYIQAVDTGGDTITVLGGSLPADGSRIFFSGTDADGNNAGFWSSIGRIEDSVSNEFYVVNGSAFFTFQVALTLGGAPIDLTTEPIGSVNFWASKIVTVNTGDQLVFAPGTISISLK